MSQENLTYPVPNIVTQIGLELEVGEDQILDEYCSVTGYTPQEVINQLVRQFLAKQGFN